MLSPAKSIWGGDIFLWGNRFGRLRYINSIRTFRILQILKLLILAKGGAHLYPRLAPTMEWDTGAAQIILEEAGGKVIKDETKAPLLYNKENLRNPHFVAYGKVVE